MHFSTIILTTILLHELSDAWDIAITCNTTTGTGACTCNNNIVSCTNFSWVENSSYILPNNTVIIHFVNVPNKILINAFTNRKLQNITWVASNIESVEALDQSDLKYLDLSRNNIHKLSNDTFYNCPQLEYVDLSHNQLNFLSDNLFINTKMLETVNLENNTFNLIPELLFKETINLKNLSIGNPNLSGLSKNAMSNLDKLEYLSIENSRIEELDSSFYNKHKYNLNSVKLNNCTFLKSINNSFVSFTPNIKVIELNNCGIINFLPASIVSLENLKCLSMFETEVESNCHNGWFSKWFNETNTVTGYKKYTQFTETINKMDCPAKIYHTSGPTTLQLTKRGIVNCMTYGNPSPAITWLVPGGFTFHENKGGDANISHHPNAHDWDLNQIDNPSLLTNKNGSLHILRMLRTSIGNYTCYVSNKYGNDSKIVQVHLDSGVFFNIKINALLLGITSALGFLMLTILCCALKLLLIRLNCIKRKNQPTEAEMGTTEKTKDFPEEV